MRWLASTRQNAIGQSVRRQHLTSTTTHHLHQPTRSRGTASVLPISTEASSSYFAFRLLGLRGQVVSKQPYLLGDAVSFLLL